MNFFENIGLLLKRGYLNAEDVWEMFGVDIFPIYVSGKQVIEETRSDDPNSFTKLQYLYEQLIIVEKRNGGPGGLPTDQELRSYWERESRTAVGPPVRRSSRKLKTRAAVAGTSSLDFGDVQGSRPAISGQTAMNRSGLC